MNNPFTDMMHPTVMAMNVQCGRNCTISRNTIIHGGDHTVTVGYATTIGGDCIITGPVTIGNYCQLGWRISIRSGSHPLDMATIYTDSRLLGGIAGKYCSPQKITIGHDVWIGDNVFIAEGVTIGNGVILGASTVVTKSLPDYAIAVGNPARILRKRFEEEIIDLFNQLKWWELTFEQIAGFAELRELFTFPINQERDKAVTILQQCIEKKGQHA